MDMVKPRKTLPYTWVLKSTSSTNCELYAGAICIHPSGILIAVTHTVKPDCLSFVNATITARTYEHGEARSVESISSAESQTFGLSLFRLVKVKDSEVFPCYTALSDTLAVKLMSPIFSFSHHRGISFVLMGGTVCQSFNSRARSLTIGSLLTADNSRNLSDYLISVDESKCDGIGRGLYNCLRRINASMPVIQVQGLNQRNLDGQSGWPVFTKDQQLIGLNAFSLGHLQFLIPAHILKQVLDSVVGQSLSVHCQVDMEEKEEEGK